jgi:hypothetical protein
MLWITEAREAGRIQKEVDTEPISTPVNTLTVPPPCLAGLNQCTSKPKKWTPISLRKQTQRL